MVLTREDLDLLRQLKAAGERGRTVRAFNIRVTLNRLAKTLGMERSTLPRNLRPLIRRRLVEVMSGPDKRAKVIRLTKAGERQVARMIPHWERAQARVLRDIGIRKWRSLGADLRLLAKNVGPAPTRKARERPPHPG